MTLLLTVLKVNDYSVTLLDVIFSVGLCWSGSEVLHTAFKLVLVLKSLRVQTPPFTSVTS